MLPCLIHSQLWSIESSLLWCILICHLLDSSIRSWLLRGMVRWWSGTLIFQVSLNMRQDIDYMDSSMESRKLPRIYHFKGINLRSYHKVFLKVLISVLQILRLALTKCSLQTMVRVLTWIVNSSPLINSPSSLSFSSKMVPRVLLQSMRLGICSFGNIVRSMSLPSKGLSPHRNWELNSRVTSTRR